ncbi:unnamed protein product [Psylliodes chrysocephalus]|uniref:Mutator-like transposase domain-containing protein n=1 Tax=Psylliodes chrysocephalus TaxID=3402493 RepID=A0A9P0CGX3_9CUCU|nr:unnamed protein product [Psylliodes chrysocephala]
MSFRQYSAHNELVSKSIFEAAWDAMDQAALEELQLAKDIGEVDEQGNGLIAVIVDGAWSKRSHKVNYNALSRVIIRNKDIVIKHELLQQRLRKRKRMVDETTEDSVITDPMNKFEVEVFISVINQAIQSISQRFEANKQIYEDFSDLDSRNFESLDLLSDSKVTDIAEKLGSIM